MNRLILTSFLLVLSMAITRAQDPVLKLSDSILQRGNYIKALEVLKSSGSDSYEVCYRQGSIHQKTGNYTQAIRFYKKALAKQSTPELKKQLAKTYRLSGGLKEAVKIYEQILQKDSTDLLLQYELSKLYVKLKQPDKALKLLEKLAASDPKNPRYPYQIGKIFNNQSAKGFLKAGDQYLKACRLDSAYLSPIYELVKFYKKLRFKDSVSIYIDKGLAIKPNNLNFLQLKVKDLYLKKEFDSALVYLDKLEANDFKTPFTYTYFGLIYLKKEAFDKAKAYLQKAQRLDPENPDILYYEGLAEKGLGNLRNAKFSFIMSISAQKPDTHKQYFELGMIALKENKTDQAVRFFKESYKNNRNNYHSLFELAMASEVYYKDKKIALGHYEKFLEKFAKKDVEMTDYARQRIKELKKERFLKGEKEGVK